MIDKHTTGREGWVTVSQATVYFDYPFHAPLEHTLHIDFVDDAAGPRPR